jgi:hypothetical protein
MVHRLAAIAASCLLGAFLGPGILARAAPGAQETSPVRLGEPHPASVTSVAWSPRGAVLATGDEAGGLRLFDAATGELRRRLPGPLLAVRAVAFSPDGTWLASGSDDRKVRVHAVAPGGETRATSNLPGGVRCVSFAPDGSRLAAGALDRVVLFDTASWERVAEIPAGFFVNSIAFSPDGTRIAIGRQDRRVRIADAETAATIVDLEGHESSVDSLAFHPSAMRIASASTDGTIRLRDLRVDGSPARERVLTAHGAAVRCIAFAPDGSLLASGSDEGDLRFWDAETGFPYATLPELGSPVRAIAFSPDSGSLACAVEREVRVLAVDRSRFARPSFELDFAIEEFRVVGETPERPVSVFLRIVNRGKSAAGPIAVTAEAATPDSRRVAPLTRVTELADLPPGDRSPTLFFDLSEEARSLFAATGEIEVRVHADSLVAPSERRTRTVRVSTLPLEMELLDVEMARDPEDGRLTTVFTVARGGARDPGPIVIESTLRAEGAPVAAATQEIDLAEAGEPRAIRLEVPAASFGVLDAASEIEATVQARRERWPRHEWRRSVTISTRPLRITLEDLAIVSDEGSASPAAVTVRLRNRSSADPGPLSVRADIAPADGVRPPPATANGRGARVSFPPGRDATIFVSLPLDDHDRDVFARNAEVVATVVVRRRRWPAHEWRESTRLSTSTLRFALERVEVVSRNGAADSIALDLAHRGETDPGPVDLEIDLDGAPAARLRMDPLPLASEASPATEILLPVPPGAGRTSEETGRPIRIDLRARRARWPARSWSESVTLATTPCDLELVERRIERDDRGQPQRFVFRLVERGAADPGPIDLTTRLHRPGRRVRDGDATVVQALDGLPPGIPSDPVSVPIPPDLLLGGLDPDGIRCRIVAARRQWPGLDWESEFSILKRPSIDLRGVEITADARGRPLGVRFRIANRADTDPGPLVAQVEFEGGLRGDVVGRAPLGTIDGMPPGSVTEPFAVPLPPGGVTAFDTSEHVRIRALVTSTDWEVLQAEASRIVPTRPQDVTLELLEVLGDPIGAPSAVLVRLVNRGKLESVPMEATLRYAVGPGRILLEDSVDLPSIPRIPAGEALPPWTLELPEEAARAIAQGRGAELRASFRGAVRPFDRICPIGISRPATPWGWIVALIIFVGITAVAVLLRMRARRDEGSETEFFAMIEEDTEERP